MNQRIVNVILFACVLVVAYIAGKALVAGEVRTLQGIIGLALLGPLLWAAQTYGIKALLYFATLMYWIPLAMPPNRSILKELHVFELAVWALCAYLFVSGAVRKKMLFPRKGLREIVPLLIFATGGILAVLVNDISTINIIKLRILVFLPIGIYVIYNALIDHVRGAELMLRISLISTLVLGLFFLVAWYGIQHFGNSFQLGPIAVSRVYSNPTESFMYSGRMSLLISMPLMGALVAESAVTSTLMSVVFAIGLSYWLGGLSFSHRFLGMLAVIVMVQIMFLCQGRTGWVAALSSSMVVLFLTLRFKTSRVMPAISKVVILILVSVPLFISVSSTPMVSRALQLLDPLQAETMISRTRLWEQGLQVLLHNPLGVGYGGGYITGAFTAHNLYLVWLLIAGIPGFLGIAWFFMFYVKQLWNGLRIGERKRSFLCITGIGAITAFLMASITETMGWTAWQIALIWIPISVTMAGATVFNKEIE